MNNKLKLISAILAACIGAFTIGMYVAHTRFNIDDHWSPGGNVEWYSWVVTVLTTLYFIYMAYSFGSKKNN